MSYSVIDHSITIIIVIDPNPGYSTGLSAKFHHKWVGENSIFLLHFLMHIHVLNCVESLNQFRSKLDFLQILKVTQKLGQRPCTIVQGHHPNFIKNG